MPHTFTSLITRYANDIALVAEQLPAKEAHTFAQQLETAASRLDDAGINGADDLSNAALYLTDAARSEDTDQQAALLAQAARYLRNTGEMVEEYRDMVGS